MIFSVERFTKNATADIKRKLPESHRLELEGREVIDGQIEYTCEGDEYCLYPVLSEWCKESYPSDSSRTSCTCERQGRLNKVGEYYQPKAKGALTDGG